jgi:DNA-binding transcriptional LysR family regulator
VNKKEAKKTLLLRALATQVQTPAGPKVFCFFFSKKKRFLSSFLSMTLDQLRAFVAVAERQHVTRAAEALNLTQPAVSAAILALEQQFQLKLFDRVGRGITLTEAGRVFLTEARAVLARTQAAELAMNELQGLARGRITIFASQTISSYFLPRRLVKFHERYPKIELAVSTGNTARVARAVLDGEAELGFVEGPVADPLLLTETIDTDQMIIVVAPQHPWAAAPRLAPCDLADSSWVLREEGSGTRAALETALAAGGIDPARLNVAIILPSNEAVRAAAEAGAGAAALSSMVCAESIAAGTLTRANFPLPPRDFVAIRHAARDPSRSVAALMEAIKAK